MGASRNTKTEVCNSLQSISIERLACLLRHWTWADEALARFDRELADTVDDDEDPIADRPFGAYYQWCALLCALTDAALDQGPLSLQMDAIRRDIQLSLPHLHACRQILEVVPASLEVRPRIVDLLRNGETLGRLRRVHRALGETLRQEQLSRALGSLDPMSD
jgi:hypothetical protein